MRRTNTAKLTWLFAALITGIAFLTSCEGPAGPAGENGLDGADGTNGVDANAHCLTCHSEAKWQGITAAYEASGHGLGAAAGYAGARSGCQDCHSSQGFIGFVKGVEVSVITGKAIDCQACHGDHGSLEEPVEVGLAITVAPIAQDDGETSLDIGGSSNLCAHCHQARTGYDYYEALDSVEIDDVMTAVPAGSVAINSSHAGPHHGPQANFLLGLGNYLELTSTHTNETCVSCHMGEPSNGTGGHTWIPNEESCTACHTNGVPDGIEGFDADLTAIADALVTEGALSLEDGEYHPNVAIVSEDVFKAFWSYMYIYEDHSHGVHNPTLAKALVADAKSKLGI